MVINNDELNLVFGALADTTRRSILADLAQGERNVRSLAEPHDMSQPAISKHLRVLERAGLISRSRRGRESYVRVRTKQVKKARDWISYYTKFWEAQFDAVEEFLRDSKAIGNKKDD